ncbi:MAG: lantibiotic dehydratase C-terminal domain-containing protein [Acidobacteriota bacterium]
MNAWRALYLHTTDLDRLVLDFLHPFFARHGMELRRAVWERHSAGGPHLRVRIEGTPEALERVGTALYAEATAYFAAHPSGDLETYSPERSRALLEREGASYDDDELVYRNNEVVERPWPPPVSAFLSPEAADLVDDFHNELGPLEHAILADTRPRREVALRLYFLHAHLVTGDVLTGSVSWKSHWEGFFSTFPSAELLERIGQSYEASREWIRGHLHEVDALASEGRLAEDPILAGWAALMHRYEARVRRELEAAHVFTFQAGSSDEAASLRSTMQQHLVRDSRFVRTFWSDDRFLTSIGDEIAFQVPRVLVNLFYHLVARVGLSPLDKMALCHHVTRAVEEDRGRDLQEVLEHNIAAVIERRAPRRAGSMAPSSTVGAE